jgi:peptidoglycan/xylan/chitin deacetylase (PgdA/CDA1 family)
LRLRNATGFAVTVLGERRSRDTALGDLLGRVLVALLVVVDACLGVAAVSHDEAQPQGHRALVIPPVIVQASPAPPRVDALHLRPRGGVRTVVSLTFDDGVEDQFLLSTLLPTYHLTATLYANSGLLADEGYVGRMSLWQLTYLSQHGVEIGGHTLDHPDLTQLSLPSAQQEICNDRDRLRAWGFRVISFAYPSSSANPGIERLPARCGYLSARSVGGVVCRGCTTAETFPPRNRYALRTPDAVETQTTARELEREVRAAERSSSAKSPAWLIFNFHHICDGCNTYAISERRLASLMNWLSHRPASTAVRSVGAVILHGFR